MKTDCSRISPVSWLMKATVTVSGREYVRSFSRHSSIVGDRLVEGELAELDGEVAGVVLDRRDVVDRLAQAALLGIDQPLERAALDVDQVGDIEDLVQARERTAHPRGVNSGQGDSWRRERAKRRAPRVRTAYVARPSKIPQAEASPGDGRPLRLPALTDPASRPRVCGAGPVDGRLRLSADRGQCRSSPPNPQRDETEAQT